MTGDLFVIRHGETEWSLSGQHTSTTDLPLTASGRRLAERMRPVLAGRTYGLVLVSPLRRARETCDLAGLGSAATVFPDLSEWRYGDYEGLTTRQIRERIPDWQIFRDGCPGGETPRQVSLRADRVIERTREVEGDVILFAHGHISRVLVARWLGLPAVNGKHFTLDTGSLSKLGNDRGVPVVKTWNGAMSL